jgi:hypothetical protein
MIRTLWAVTLFDEVRELGYPGGYSTFTRGVRTLRLRPHCEPCAAAPLTESDGDGPTAESNGHESTYWS